jgi:tRNA1Val (adenine37-N6)-methyltransferase
MPFRFKQFSVEDDQSSMRIGTDAILLGAWADVYSAKNILEIGTGCGVIALMMAQRSTAHITAIDIHQDSVKQATVNFRSSPWSYRLTPVNISCKEFAVTSKENFDLVISNPPFFSKSLKSPDGDRNLARHDDNLPVDELFDAVHKLFKSHRTPECTVHLHSLNIIIPSSKTNGVVEIANRFGFAFKKQLFIFPKPGKPANRVIMEFSDQPVLKSETAYLTLRTDDNSFSEDYKELTKDFYLDF